LNRYDSVDALPAIPQERIFIDAIILDEELQLERELIEEELRPIDAFWAAYEPRATWPQILPMQEFEPEPDWQLNILQLQFLKHLVYHGEIGSLEAVGLAHHLAFRTAYELFCDKWGNYALQTTVREAANLTSALQVVV
jgi:hypothetical protein